MRIIKGIFCIIFALALIAFGFYLDIIGFSENPNEEIHQKLDTIVVDERERNEKLQELIEKTDVLAEKVENVEAKIDELSVPVTPTTPVEEEPTEAVEEIESEPEPLYIEQGVGWYSNEKARVIGEPTELVGGEEFDREFLAKLTYCEAGATSWECQIYTCSAILNLCDARNESLSSLGHNKNVFSVAPWVDSAEPSELTYEVVNYVLNGGRVENIKYFRTGDYHTFGMPVCKVGPHYFSM